MEKYRIQESIRDVINILDSAPIRWDLVSDTNIIQLTNRIPIAHLAIERGLKALITESGGELERTHSLARLYRAFQECDVASADYLENAFADAVQFFGYNVNRKGFRQFRSLDIYLSKVGTEDAFDELRYWAIGESNGEASPIPYISLPIHRELLCALWCLFLPSSRETVSGRVEREVSEEMFSRRLIGYSSDDTHKEQSVHWYMSWLRSHASPRGAMEEAYRKGFALIDDEFITQTLQKAYEELQQSDDPAVLYFLSTLSYLPTGSEHRNSDAIPEVHWIGERQARGQVVTPAGTPLGYIERYANGAWGVTPFHGGLVRIGAIAWAQADAKHYLVNRLTSQVVVIVNSESRQLRIIDDRGSFFRPAWLRENERSTNLIQRSAVYKLEFWDSQHGLRLGDSIVAKLQSKPSDGTVSVLEGVVTSMDEQRVSVTGSDYFDIKRDH